MSPKGRADAEYPAWAGERVSLKEAIGRGGGAVAGRYLRGTTRDLVEDASGVAEVVARGTRPGHGDQVAGRLAVAASGPHELVDARILAPALRPLGPGDLRLGRLRPALAMRARAIQSLRDTLARRGYLEVETPSRVLNPGLEPHLRPFPAGTGPDGRERWLATSPELHLKRFLGAGYERIFELARCFRDEERGAVHASEFLMLEWYRTHAGLHALAADLAELLPAAARAVGADPAEGPGGCDLAAPFETVTVARLFRERAKKDVFALSPADRDEIFVTLEPELGRRRPLLVTEYPEDAAALARLVPSSDTKGRRVAARMELYVAGLELANGFDELVDPKEQRRRHEADRAARLAAGQPAPPLDEAFLAALEGGVPPSAGMALGVDRLVMLLLGKRDIADVRAFARGDDESP